MYHLPTDGQNAMIFLSPQSAQWSLSGTESFFVSSFSFSLRVKSFQHTLQMTILSRLQSIEPTISKKSDLSIKKSNNYFWLPQTLKLKSETNPFQPMYLWQWQSVFHEEVVFHLDNPIVISLRILYDFLEDLWIDVPFSLCIVSLIVVELSALYNLSSFRYIHIDMFISPEISVFFYLFLGKGVVYQIRHRIVEIEWIEISRKEISEYPASLHLSEYLIGKLEPFLTSILLIEDTIGFVFEADASETEGTILKKKTMI